MRGWVALVVIGLFAAVGAATAIGSSSSKGPNLRDLQGVNFISACRFSHRAMDDPIVFPGRPGLSHDHSFVGNTTTNAYSTLRTLRAATTTCRRVEDTAAYWMPTLLQNGNPVEPRGATIYYRRKTIAQVHAFPPGLRMIAGNSHSTTAQDLHITYWNCGAQTGIAPSAEVPTCPSGRGSELRLHVEFPNCWDGTNLDSVNHQSHMAYSVRGVCPADHPVAVPAIALIYRYPITGGAGVTLSSGGQYSAHADFFNAWQQRGLVSLVRGCLNALRHCAQGE